MPKLSKGSDYIYGEAAFEVLARAQELERQGNKTYGVHPFKLVGYIISNPELKTCFKAIFDTRVFSPSRIVRYTFFKGLSIPFNGRARAGVLMREDHIEGFARETHKDSREIRRFVERSKWEDLFGYLVS